MSQQNDFKQQINRQVKRLRKAEQQRSTILSQTIYLGTLGLLMVLPIVACAYLGRWLDSLASGYSTRWTISLLLLGVVVGVVNVYLFLRK